MGRLVAALTVMWLLPRALEPAAQGEGTADDTVVSGPVAQAIDGYLTRCVPFGFSGSVLVARDATVILAKGYGVADRETGAACSPATVFDLGSITKQFTAAAVLVLEQQKKLDTRATLADLLADVPSDKKKIQIHHLLSHTSGLPRSIPSVGSRIQGRDELIRAVLGVPLLDPPGSTFIYSNVGYDLLAAVVELVAERPFEQVLEELVFQPAGLASTGFRGDGRLPAARAARALMKPDDPPPAGSLLEGSPPGNRSDERELATDGWYSWGLRGAGGVLSTVADLWRWEGALRGDALLTDGSKKKLFTPVLEQYGYGWYVLKSERRTTWIEHGGSTGSGFDGKVARFPDEGAFVTTLGNVPGLVPWVNLNVHALLFGGKCALPPAVDTPSPAELEALTGEYVHEGSRWRVANRGGGLGLEARSPRAFELLAGKLSGDRKNLLKLSEKIVAGFARADFETLHAHVAEGRRFDWLDSWWQGLLRHHGSLRQATVLGLLPDDQRMNQVVVLAEFERGEELMRLEWGAEELFGLNIGPPYPSRLRLMPESAASFVWFDLRKGAPTAGARVSAPGELVLELPGGTLAVKRK